MIITVDNEPFYEMAKKVDFLTEYWEKVLYMKALEEAYLWGQKVDKQNKEYFNKNHLIDKYNV